MTPTTCSPKLQRLFDGRRSEEEARREREQKHDYPCVICDGLRIVYYDATAYPCPACNPSPPEDS